MISDLNTYFQPEQEFFLDSIHYQHKEKISNKSDYILASRDVVKTKEIDSNRLMISVTRSLQFDPDDLFELNVTYSVILKYVDPVKAKSAFEGIDLSLEFIQNGQFALANIVNRISLLIAEITASFGQPPIVTPPSIIPQQ